MMSYTLFYYSNINSYFFCNLIIFIKNNRSIGFYQFPILLLFSYDKFVLYKELQSLLSR
jgi:hypothetical protein